MMPHTTYEPSEIPGAARLIDWFTEWPSFHDAEVLEISLRRSSRGSFIKLHTWKHTNVIDQKGYLVREREVVVTLHMFDILDLDLHGFNHQNVISGLEFEPVEKAIAVKFMECFGLAGFIIASELEVSFTPGAPEMVGNAPLH